MLDVDNTNECLLHVESTGYRQMAVIKIVQTNVCVCSTLSSKPLIVLKLVQQVKVMEIHITHVFDI